MVGYLYQWQKNGGDILGAILPAYTVLAAGNYTYRATDINGCSAVSPITVITANCKNDDGEFFHGISIPGINLYPNPAYNVIHIDATFISQSDGQALLEIKNVLGETIYSCSENIVSGTCKANVTLDHRFTQGVYFAQMKSGAEILLQQFVIAGSGK